MWRRRLQWTQAAYKMLDESSTDSDFSAVYAYVSSIFSTMDIRSSRKSPAALARLGLVYNWHSSEEY